MLEQWNTGMVGYPVRSKLGLFRTCALPGTPISGSAYRQELGLFGTIALGSSGVGRSFGKLRTGSRPTPSWGDWLCLAHWVVLVPARHVAHWVRFASSLPPRPRLPVRRGQLGLFVQPTDGGRRPEGRAAERIARPRRELGLFGRSPLRV